MQLFILVPIEANDFSSFLSANASLGKFWIYKEFFRKKSTFIACQAVVVDQEYMTMRGENIMAHVEKILSDIIRENLRNGGINVKYFTWNAVRLKKGEVFSYYNSWVVNLMYCRFFGRHYGDGLREHLEVLQEHPGEFYSVDCHHRFRLSSTAAKSCSNGMKYVRSWI